MAVTHKFIVPGIRFDRDMISRWLQGKNIPFIRNWKWSFNYEFIVTVANQSTLDALVVEFFDMYHP